MWPLLPVASRGQALLNFDLNSLLPPPLPFGRMEACFKFFGFSSRWLIVFMLELVSVVLLLWWLWLFKISSCWWYFVSVWFCRSVGQFLLKAYVYLYIYISLSIYLYIYINTVHIYIYILYIYIYIHIYIIYIYIKSKTTKVRNV